ncbi:MAG: riboflavin biosynthesis protein RibF [Clostridia bacterium]|nr:riboflavin biosynthesis protein RibF [Clostridia bacterium]
MSDRKKAVVALGYFDGVHKGHVAVIKTAREIADKHGFSLVVASFGGNLRAALYDGEGSFIFREEERKRLFLSLGADETLFFPTDREFLGKTGEEFLDGLNGLYAIAEYVCGEDYRFGKFGACDVKFLKNYAKIHGQRVTVAETLSFGGEKISASLIKRLFLSGRIREANGLLYSPYFISGKVVKGRGEGRILGFPTANIEIDRDKAALRDGVYAGEITVDGRKYKAVINYGNSPTFSREERLIEAFIPDFSGDLYGKEITVGFTDYIREIKKFGSEEEFERAIEKDVETVTGKGYDKVRTER